MIHRIWHGWTTADDAGDYQRLLLDEVIPGIAARQIAGVSGITVLRRDDDQAGEVEFVTIMQFASWSAVEAFAGPGGTHAVVPSRARDLLVRFDDHSTHYDHVATRQLEPHALR